MQIKRVFTLVLVIVMIFCITACNTGNHKDASSSTNTTLAQNSTGASEKKDDIIENSTDESNASKNDVLILYFSANNTKNTDAVSSATPMSGGKSSVEWIADIIHDEVGGDIVPIIPTKDYPLKYNDVADYAKNEADKDLRPAFEELGVDPESYKTIFIGYPVWWYTTPKILETFFETYDLTGKTIIPFNTHAGSRDGGTYTLIQKREPNATVLKGLAVRGEDVGKEDEKKSVLQWLKEVY